VICQEAHKLIHPYLDRGLDLVRNLEIEAHLHDCQTYAQAYNGASQFAFRAQRYSPVV
jgi:Putative zinc-finger